MPANLRRVHHVTEAVQAVVGSIAGDAVLKRCALLRSMWDLKAPQMNVQRGRNSGYFTSSNGTISQRKQLKTFVWKVKALFKNNTLLSPFWGFMGGASKNHVTVVHVTIPKASSTSFWQLTSMEEEPISFVSALREALACKLSSENFLFSRKPQVFNNCYSPFLVLWNRFCNLFNVLGHSTCFIIMCKYMYIKYTLFWFKLTWCFFLTEIFYVRLVLR